MRNYYLVAFMYISSTILIFVIPSIANDVGDKTKLTGNAMSTDQAHTITSNVDNPGLSSDQSAQSAPLLSTESPVKRKKRLCTGNCVRKCCGKDKIFKQEFPPCGVDNNVDIWRPSNVIDVVMRYGMPKPKEGESCLQHFSHEFYLANDGRLHLTDASEVYDYNSYCIDHAVEGNKTVLFAAICIKNVEQDTFEIISNKFHFAGCIISCISLVILLILHFFVMKKSHDFHSKCLVTMVVAMLSAYITLSINISSAVLDIRKPNCIALALCQQFFFLSFYFWLNVKCFELWRIIRGYATGSDLSEGTLKRYLLYSLYAWGIPFLIGVITLTMQLIPQDHSSSFIRPRLAEGRCWFYESMDILFSYYYGIQVVLNATNVLLVVHAGCMMYCKGQQPLDADSKIHSRDKSLKTFWMQFRIISFIIFLWALDSISLIESKWKVWRFIDILNTFQGLFLLILVVVGDRNFRKEMKNFFSSYCRGSNKINDKSTEASNVSTQLNTRYETFETSNM